MYDARESDEQKKNLSQCQRTTEDLGGTGYGRGRRANANRACRDILGIPVRGDQYVPAYELHKLKTYDE